MSDIGLTLIILIAAIQGGYIGYCIGMVRTQNRLIPEILKEREEASKLRLLMKLEPAENK